MLEGGDIQVVIFGHDGWDVGEGGSASRLLAEQKHMLVSYPLNGPCGGEGLGL